MRSPVTIIGASLACFTNLCQSQTCVTYVNVSRARVESRTTIFGASFACLCQCEWVTNLCGWVTDLYGCVTCSYEWVTSLYVKASHVHMNELRTWMNVSHIHMNKSRTTITGAFCACVMSTYGSRTYMNESETHINKSRTCASAHHDYWRMFCLHHELICITNIRVTNVYERVLKIYGWVEISYKWVTDMHERKSRW